MKKIKYFPLEGWLAAYKIEARQKRFTANQENALNKHDKERSETYRAKCLKHKARILNLVKLGRTAREIADEIGVDRTHIYDMFRFLGITNYTRSNMARR